VFYFCLFLGAGVVVVAQGEFADAVAKLYDQLSCLSRMEEAKDAQAMKAARERVKAMVAKMVCFLSLYVCNHTL
jgi:hypothetical protein